MHVDNESFRVRTSEVQGARCKVQEKRKEKREKKQAFACFQIEGVLKRQCSV